MPEIIVEANFGFAVFIKVFDGANAVCQIDHSVADAEAIKAFNFARDILKVHHRDVAVIVLNDGGAVIINFLNCADAVLVVEHSVIQADRGAVVTDRTLRLFCKCGCKSSSSKG